MGSEFKLPRIRIAAPPAQNDGMEAVRRDQAIRISQLETKVQRLAGLETEIAKIADLEAQVVQVTRGLMQRLDAMAQALADCSALVRTTVKAAPPDDMWQGLTRLCAEHGVTPEALIGHGRSTRLLLARVAFIEWARGEGHSLRRIGQVLGDRSEQAVQQMQMRQKARA